MELLIILIVVIVLLIIMGISFEFIMFGLMLLMSTMMLALTIFFVWCICRLTVCKKCEGKLAKVEINPKFGFGTPHYDISGKTYANVFPCEVVMKKQLYYEGRKCVLRLDEKRGKVFDGNAMLSTVFGVILSAASFILLLSRTMDMFPGISMIR